MSEKVYVEKTNQVVKIDASGLSFRDLNARLREAVSNGPRRIELHNVYGQRYIGTNLDKPIEVEIFGIPGNDLGRSWMALGLLFMAMPRMAVATR